VPKSLKIPDFLHRKESKAEEEKTYEEFEDAEICSAPAAEEELYECSSMSLDDTLKEMYTDSFEKHLQQLINKKGLKNSEVYAAANISKQYFSKLIKGQVKPSKEKVLALAVGLQLNMDEAIDFLRLAGYAFSPVSQTDVIVEYFIMHRDYNVMKIDIVLFDYGLDSLSR
jgi:transcriptional regulator with XRE-family HTH domain